MQGKTDSYDQRVVEIIKRQLLCKCLVCHSNKCTFVKNDHPSESESSSGSESDTRSDENESSYEKKSKPHTPLSRLIKDKRVVNTV